MASTITAQAIAGKGQALNVLVFQHLCADAGLPAIDSSASAGECRRVVGGAVARRERLAWWKGSSSQNPTAIIVRLVPESCAEIAVITVVVDGFRPLQRSLGSTIDAEVREIRGG